MPPERLRSVVLSDFRPASPEELLNRLKPIFDVTPVGKPWIPANPRSIFEPAHDELQTIYTNLSGAPLSRTQTKSELWLELLRTGSMEPENDVARRRLFVTHSFLIALARGVIHTISQPNQEPDERLILRDGFVSWVLESSAGRDWAHSLLTQVHSYEWRKQRGDVLRPLYERFVDANDRKTFGEYYTPDWLAAMLVEQILDDGWCDKSIRAALVAERSHEELEGIGVLDPTCGSGTFLYHAAQRLLQSPLLEHVSASRRAAVVARLVIGIDVHPVAGEIARATLLRALPTEPPNGEAAIRVYVGDSLLVNTFDEDSLFRRLNGEVRISTPGGRYVSLPRSFIEQPDFSDNLRRLIASATLNESLPIDVIESVPRKDQRTLKESHQAFRSIIANEGNSVWTWYIANTAGPLRLREQRVDRIVANPPWVSMTDIQVPSRKRALEEFASDRMKLWTGGRNAPHFDIAQLFIKRTRELYLQDPENDPAAWLVKKSALLSGGWQRFRDWHEPIKAQTLDLEAIQPFGGGDARRCCVLFDVRKSSLQPYEPNDAIFVVNSGNRLMSDMTLIEARNQLSFYPSPEPFPERSSEYVNSRGDPLFRQGASITPKVLTVVSEAKPAGQRDEMLVTTQRSNNEPWNQVKVQEGIVTKTWVRSLLTSSELLVFACAQTLPRAIIPTSRDGTLDKDAIANSEFWASLDKIYEEHRGIGRRTPKTLLSQLDYSNKLTSQLERRSNRKIMVLHPTSGDVMRASRSRPGTAVIQHTIHYYMCGKADEAAYLVALLNAPCLSRAFSECRTSGRHFTNSPWRSVPIPKYDETNPHHKKLANLCKRAERIVENWIKKRQDKLGQVAASKRIRELLDDKGILAVINTEARFLLPDHSE